MADSWWIWNAIFLDSSHQILRFLLEICRATSKQASFCIVIILNWLIRACFMFYLWRSLQRSIYYVLKNEFYVIVKYIYVVTFYSFSFLWSNFSNKWSSIFYRISSKVTLLKPTPNYRLYFRDSEKLGISGFFRSRAFSERDL